MSDLWIFITGMGAAYLSIVFAAVVLAILKGVAAADGREKRGS